ncbi:MAG: DUF1036 domain-containing protein [Solirubrobacterales bacterium]|nr:DUF1036 domain-containing protein [Solirubrobacterales bacterium]MBV9713900.1 DUF1036 domain-containing protein [Solirubrobacterales bacterium]
MSTKSLSSGRRVASLSAALACACALLASLLAVNANAAGKVVVAARPSARGTAALRLEKPVSGSVVRTGTAKPYVSPFGTSVYFQNSYGKTVWVTTERYNSGCNLPGVGNWENEGWYRLDPGQSEWLFTTTNEYAYFYAEAADGAKWSGAYGGRVNPYYAYDYCNSIDSYATDPGMRQIDLGGWNLFGATSYTLTLIP